MPSGHTYCLLLGLVTAGCTSASGSSIAGGEADSVYIGFAVSIDSVGDSYLHGAQLALMTINAARPVHARPLALRMPVRGMADIMIAAGFRDDPHVVAVIGHTGSAATLAAAPIYADAEHGGRHAILAVTPTATNPAVTRTTHWVYRVCPTDDASARALARYATDSMHTSRVAIIYRDDIFGRGFSRAFSEEFIAHHGTVVERDPYLRGMTEFDAYAGRLARGRADLVLIAGGSVDGADIVHAVRRAGSRARFIGSDDLSALTGSEFAGLRYTAFFNPNAPGAQAFDSSYQRTFGLPPDQRAALAHDAAELIGRAVMAVGPDRQKVRDWVAQAPPLEGATGTIRFSAQSGDPLDKPVTIGEITP